MSGRRRRIKPRVAVTIACSLVVSGCTLLVDLDGLGGDAPADAASERSDATAPGKPVADATAADADASVVSDGAPPPGPCVPSGTVESKVASPSTAVDDARIGTIAWTNPANATATDGAFARTASMTGAVITHWLRGSAFGVALPARAVVRGFVVEIAHKASFADEIADHGVALVKAGNPGAPRSLPASWPTALETVTYGTPSDLWGATWTAEEVNAADFGVAVAARGAPASDETGSVDSLRVRVYFERCAP